MPAKSKNQQAAAGLALRAKRGEISFSSLRKSARQMYESMSAHELEHYASTPRKGLPKRKKKRKKKK